MKNSEVIVYSFTVEDGVKSGEFIDMDELAKEAGIKFKTVFSRNLFNSYIVPSEKDAKWGQCIDGRAWDVFTMFKYALKNRTESVKRPHRFEFETIFLTNGSHKTVNLVAVIQAYNESGEPCLTISLPEDD